MIIVEAAWATSSYLGLGYFFLKRAFFLKGELLGLLRLVIMVEAAEAPSSYFGYRIASIWRDQIKGKASAT